MHLLSKLTGLFRGKASRGGSARASAASHSTQKAPGAGPALAAHSKDAKSAGAAGNNPQAAAKSH